MSLCFGFERPFAMIPENFDICPLITATVRGFARHGISRSCIYEHFYQNAEEKSGNFSRERLIDFPKWCSLMITDCYRLIGDKIEETPGR